MRGVFSHFNTGWGKIPLVLELSTRAVGGQAAAAAQAPAPTQGWGCSHSCSCCLLLRPHCSLVISPLSYPAASYPISPPTSTASAPHLFLSSLLIFAPCKQSPCMLEPEALGLAPAQLVPVVHSPHDCYRG